jgi:Asp/Glu/hydantoin racemase
MIETGGKAVYGAAVGILMLQARFPRIPGDMGNALTWPFPVLYRVVRDASPDRVVRRGAEGLRDAFVAAAKGLVADGADGITTNCGFLSLYQAELAAAVGVPVATSSLMQVAMVNTLLPPGRRAGILTISASTLTGAHLTAAGVPPGTPIGTTEGGAEFTRAILGDELDLDVDAARADNVDAARALQAAHPNLGAIVLECTNMIPYAADIRAATGLPTFSMGSFVSWFQSGLTPRRYGSGS